MVGNGWFGIPLASLNGSKPDIVLSTTPLKLALIFVHMYFAWGLFASVKWAWAELNKTVHPTVHMIDQLFLLHCTADWGQHGLRIVNKSQKMLEDDGNGLAPSFLLVSINVRKRGPLKIEK